jgi:hypothetical protein
VSPIGRPGSAFIMIVLCDSQGQGGTAIGRHYVQAHIPAVHYAKN